MVSIDIEVSAPLKRNRYQSVACAKARSATHSREARMTTTAKIRVLTVDDHPLLREGIKAIIDQAGDMEMVAQATNGREAIQQFRKVRPDVTLMDVQMPEIDGIEALIAIRNEYPDARVIVLTTYKGDAQAMRALKAGAQ